MFDISSPTDTRQFILIL